MKKLDTSNISNSSQFFVKRGTLQFLQDSYTECFDSIVKGLVGSSYSTSTIYILHGCVQTGTLPVNIISAGAVFYNGELFLVDAANFTNIGANVAVFSLSSTQYTIDADPVTFTDATVRNVHNIRKMAITSAASGSGIANYTQAVRLNFTPPVQITLDAPTSSPYGDNIAQIIPGSFPDYKIYVPQPNLTMLSSGSYSVGSLASSVGARSFTITFASALPTAAYTIIGSFDAGNVALGSVPVFAVRSKTINGFSILVSDVEGNYPTQNFTFDWIAIAQ